MSSHLILQSLDWFFLFFHTSFTVFNLIGWALPRFRRIHLACLVLTASSWLLLGLHYGLGYCFCTDWHFQVLSHLGVKELPMSYITYLIERWTPFEARDDIIIPLTGIIFVIVCGLSVGLNIKDSRGRKAAKK